MGWKPCKLKLMFIKGYNRFCGQLTIMKPITGITLLRAEVPRAHQENPGEPTSPMCCYPKERQGNTVFRLSPHHLPTMVLKMTKRSGTAWVAFPCHDAGLGAAPSCSLVRGLGTHQELVQIAPSQGTSSNHKTLNTNISLHRPFLHRSGFSQV